MSGVVAMAKLMFTAVPLQRWFLRIAVVSTLIGLGTMAAGARGSFIWWASALLIGSCILAVSIPVALAGILFRYLSASRALVLIPHGRVQLLVGSFLTDLLIALIAALFFATITAPAHLAAVELARYSAFAAALVCTFAAATLAFITLYYSSGSQLGVIAPLILIAVLQILPRAFPQWHAHDFFASSTGLSITFVCTLALWTLFGALYLSSGRISPPVWGQAMGTPPYDASVRMRRYEARGAGPAAPYARRDAVRALLIGRHARFRDGLTRSLIPIVVGSLCVFFLLIATADNHRPLSGIERFLAIMLSYTGGAVTALATQQMIGRARYLWLRSCFERKQLFAAVEAESWRTFIFVGGGALMTAAFFCLMSDMPHALVTQILLLSFASCVGMIYLVLMHTRGWRIADILLVAAFSALWFLGMVRSVVDFGSSPLLLSLLGLNLVLIPVLRASAQARWTRIDWVINRPVRFDAAARGLSSAAR